MCPGEYLARFGLTAERLAQAAPDAVVMHPGPMNRGVEIEGAIADDPERSLIALQVEMGVAVRMACLEMLIGGVGLARGDLHRRVAREIADEAVRALAAQRFAQRGGLAVAVEAPDRQAVEGALGAREAGAHRRIGLERAIFAGGDVPGGGTRCGEP